ncbi:MAG: biotin synthase BioB [Parachlamydia sp.]|jgi:biotin synthase|nr:biotin synthase BioB [Parachlamydia sp.]
MSNEWTLEELEQLYATPLLELLSKAQQVHQQFHSVSEIQVCRLISIKTGGCPEDCKYCAQSSRYQTAVKPGAMLSYEQVMADAKQAVEAGATRVCLGVAWREVREGKPFEEVLRMIKGIEELGAEVCCTLGMLNRSQAERLSQAGLYAYNHNLDTSERYYPSIISTRSYQDRLNTLQIAEEAGLKVCCGGILGLGETVQDRLELLLVLSRRNPDSVPINRLSPIEGTPLENQAPVPFWEFLRIIAVARIIMPHAQVRLSSGRIEMSVEQQALCFLAGANSIFSGEKLLTVDNNSIEKDDEMFKLLNLKKRSSYAS